MKKFIKQLFFDREFVEKLKQAKVHKGYLQNLLLEGKITLKEYLSADYKPQS